MQEYTELFELATEKYVGELEVSAVENAVMGMRHIYL
jgi:hypothetical protein